MKKISLVILTLVAITLTGYVVLTAVERKHSDTIQSGRIEPPPVSEIENKVSPDDSASEVVPVSPAMELKVGDVVAFKRELRIAYFDAPPYEGELIQVEFASSTRYPENTIPDLPYQVKRVQNVRSQDGVVNHTAFYACPWPDFSEENHGCERFVLNSSGKVVALETYGQPDSSKDGTVVKYDFNFYPYIYTFTEGADGTMTSSASLSGLNADSLEKRTFWTHEYGIWGDESCGEIELDPDFGWRTNGSYNSYSLDISGPELRIESSQCSGLRIYSKKQTKSGLSEQEEDDQNDLLLSRQSFTNLDSKFSEDHKYVLIYIDESEYKYSFETDVITQIK